MLNLFKKSPIKQLEAEYKKKLEEANAAQRGGNMPLFAVLSKEAEDIGEKLDEARAQG